MTRSFAALCVLVALCPGPALAGICPVSRDHAVQGVEITYADGSRSVSVLDPDTGAVTETWSQPEGTSQVSVLEHGVYPSAMRSYGPEGQELPGGATLRYDVTPVVMDAAGLAYEGSYTAIYEAGPVQGYMAVKSAAVVAMQIGGCTYRTMKVTALQREPEMTLLMQMDMIPDMGISVLRAVGADLSNVTMMEPVSIGLYHGP